MASKKLSEFIPGEQGYVDSILAKRETTDRLLELGIGLGEAISLVGKAPMGDPLVLDLMNYRLSIRKTEAEKIVLRDVKMKKKKVKAGLTWKPS